MAKPKTNTTSTTKASTKTSGAGFFTNIKLQLVVLVVLSFILYGKALKFGFNYLDDSILVIDQYKLNSDYNNIPKAFSQHIFKVDGQADRSHDYYRPLMTLSFMLDAHIAGSPAPYFYHLTNVLLHILTGLLLLIFFKKFGVAPVPSFILCLFFLVHPALAQAVAWIPGRNDSLLAVFVLASFIFLIRYLEEKKPYLLALHILMFVLGLFAKENGIMLVPLTFFYLKFIHPSPTLPNGKGEAATSPFLPILNPFQRKGLDRVTPFPSERVGDRWIGVCYLICILPWWFMRQAALDANNSIYIGNIFKNIFTNAPMISQYIGKTIFPFDLSVLPTIRDTHYIWGILAVGLVATAIYFTPNKRWNYIIFGLLWYFLFLFPALVSPFVGLEHRIYVPMFGFLLIMANTHPSLPKGKETVITSPFPPLPTSPKGRRNTSPFLWKGFRIGGFRIGCMVAYLLLFWFLTQNRLPVFKDRISFYKNGTETSEYGTFAYLTLGKQYEKIEKYDSAIVTYQRGLKVDSTLVMFHNNMATDYMKLDMFPEAEKEIFKELALHPDNYTALQNLGTVYKLTDRMDLAAEQWKKVLKIKKDFSYAYQELAKYYLAKGDTLNYVSCQRALAGIK
ncbi:MAG: tetratricopeptide repeat protein [Bacteroidia bacterium]